MKVDNMGTTELQEQRAKNIIWNAAEDYSFLPDFEAFNTDGEADLYFNCIIGAVHRYYDYAPFQDLFLRMGRMPEAELFRSLLWLGLEQCVYHRAWKDRPALQELRTSYARRILQQSQSYWDQELFDRLRTAHFAKLLNENARLSKKEQRLLSALEFDDSLNAEQIAVSMCEILKKYFGCRLPKLNEKNRVFRLPFRFRKAALHGSLAQATGQTTSSGHHLTVYLPSFHAGTRSEHMQTWLENQFGISVYTKKERMELEKQLCTTGHRYCHLYVTRGEYRQEVILHPNGQYSSMIRQRERNLQFYREHLPQNMLSISRLTERILNALQFDDGRSPLNGRSGQLITEKVWRAAYLQDSIIFQRTEACEKGTLSVDILLDASASQRERQERIASQAYIMAESLSQCRIPVRVTSYCTVDGCTILHLFRDYQETGQNTRIFDYCASGWNRDGLAIRLIGHRLLESDYDHRILIILSDCSPNDDHRLTEWTGVIPHFYDYGGSRGILDTAREVSHLRRQGISVLAVCIGRERDLNAARQIYDKDVVYATSPERFADAVGYLLTEKLRYL